VLQSGRLTSNAGEARISGGMMLADQQVDARITLLPSVSHPPEVSIRLSGPLDRTSGAPELAGLARWMAELVH
jgi:hypothetical protein